MLAYGIYLSIYSLMFAVLLEQESSVCLFSLENTGLVR